jgi:hypothetical protein
MKTGTLALRRVEDNQNRHDLIKTEGGVESIVKRFENKRLYLPSELAKFRAQETKTGADVLWLGLTGYTKPPTYYAERYGVPDEPALYETLVTATLVECAATLAQAGIRVDIRHGTSDAGADRAAMRAMSLLGLSGSGVNCLEYLAWVADDERGGAAYIAQSAEEYHEVYANLNQVLLVTGGRAAAFQHDYLKRISGEGYSVVADVLQTAAEKTIPSHDIPPGTDEQTLGNAAAYVREKNCFPGSIPTSYDELIAQTQQLVLRAACSTLELPVPTNLLKQLEHAYRIAQFEKTPNTRVRSVAMIEEKIAEAVDRFYANTERTT